MDKKFKSYEDEGFEEKKYEKSAFRKKLHTQFLEFCGSTKLYGFNYLGERKRTTIEILFWLIFICLSFYFSVTLIGVKWTEWKKSPIVIATKDSRPIWDLPFPAVTICPETKVRQSVYNFTDYYHKVRTHNITSEELQDFSDTSLFCDNHLMTSGNKTTIYERVMKRLQDVSPSLKRVLFGCKWSSRNENCSNLFTPIVTEDGLCFTFNMLQKEQIFSHRIANSSGTFSGMWTPEGYLNNSIENTHPRRTTTSGSKGGLFLLLTDFLEDLDYVCRGPVQGFRVLLHQPNEVPKIGSHYIRVPLNQEVVLAVQPKLQMTSDNLRNLDVNERGCFFNDEHQLKYFRQYTEENCRSECLAEFTLSKCGCVGFYMPHEPGTKICGSGSNGCIFEADQEILIREAESKYNSANKSTSCNCLPACTSLSYSAEISQADFNWLSVLQSFESDPNEFPKIQMARLTVFFKDLRYTATERTTAYEITDILAYCGGLLAFFSGFSFLTIVEVLYFLTLRIVCNLRRVRTEFWERYETA